MGLVEKISGALALGIGIPLSFLVLKPFSDYCSRTKVDIYKRASEDESLIGPTNRNLSLKTYIVRKTDSGTEVRYTTLPFQFSWYDYNGDGKVDARIDGGVRLQGGQVFKFRKEVTKEDQHIFDKVISKARIEGKLD